MNVLFVPSAFDDECQSYILTNSFDEQQIANELAQLYKSFTPVPELQVSSFDVIHLKKCTIFVPNPNYSNPKCARLANAKPLVNETMNDICGLVIPGEVFIISKEIDLTKNNNELEKIIRQQCTEVADKIYAEVTDFIKVNA